MITSVQNSKIKWIRSLQAQSRFRREEQLFVVEGVRLVEEALAAHWTAVLVLYDPQLGERGTRIVEQFLQRGVPVEAASPHVMDAAGDTQTSQGILAVVEMKEVQPVSLVTFALVVDGIRDPGNLGTLLRTAAAAGVDQAVLAEGTVDPYAPKVVRAAMGAHFRLPLCSRTWQEIDKWLANNSLRAYLADSDGELLYTQADFKKPAALIMGSEARGAGPTARQAAATTVRLPMAGGIESLNAATAGAILLYEVVRQRS